MEGYPAINLSHSYNMQLAMPLHAEAVQKASVGDFDGAEGLLWTIAAIYHGGGPNATEDDPPYVREASGRVICDPNGWPRPPCGKSRIPPRDPSAGLESMVSAVDAAKAKWEEGAPARAAEWEKGAPLRKVAEEVARLKAEIARVEQEEVDRQAALAKEAALEKMRIQEEEEEKQRKAEVTSLERDAAALREKLAAMKELMALKAADPIAYAAATAPISVPAPTTAAQRQRPCASARLAQQQLDHRNRPTPEEREAISRSGRAATEALLRARALAAAAAEVGGAYDEAADKAAHEANEARDAHHAMQAATAANRARRIATAVAAVTAVAATATAVAADVEKRMAAARARTASLRGLQAE